MSQPGAGSALHRRGSPEHPGGPAWATPPEAPPPTPPHPVDRARGWLIALTVAVAALTVPGLIAMRPRGAAPDLGDVAKRTYVDANIGSTIALAGSLVSLAITALLALVAASATQLSGLASDESQTLRFTAGALDLVACSSHRRSPPATAGRALVLAPWPPVGVPRDPRACRAPGAAGQRHPRGLPAAPRVRADDRARRSRRRGLGPAPLGRPRRQG